jgi:hypothetical protein
MYITATGYCGRPEAGWSWQMHLLTTASSMKAWVDGPSFRAMVPFWPDYNAQIGGAFNGRMEDKLAEQTCE